MKRDGRTPRPNVIVKTAWDSRSAGDRTSERPIEGCLPKFDIGVLIAMEPFMHEQSVASGQT
jgi:hypothetical protein